MIIKLKTLLEVQLVKEALPISKAREYVDIKRNPKIQARMNSIVNFLKNQPDAVVSKNGYRVAIPMQVEVKKGLTYDSSQFNDFYQTIDTLRERVNEFLEDEYPWIEDHDLASGKFKDQYGRDLKPSKYINAIVTKLYKYEPNNTIDANSPTLTNGPSMLWWHQQMIALRKQYDTNPDVSTRIQKLTTDLLNQYDSIPEVQELRGNKEKSYYIVFSTHAYDIAGMSTNRGWSTCMNLYDGGSFQYVKQDVIEGTIVAYLVSQQDLNIQNPTSRIAIKPYINVNDPNDVLYDPDPEYGTAPSKFHKTVLTLIDQAQPGKRGQFELVDSLYCDDALRDRSSIITKK